MIGTILKEKYLIKKELGSGGFGEVYLAEYPYNLNVKPQQQCVIKKLKLEKANNQESINRFKKEAEILYKLMQNLENESICKFIEYFEHNNSFYIVQEFIDGQDLSFEITENQSCEEDYVVDLLQQILRILIYLQQQEPSVIHRDIKPHNIMRRYDDGRFVLIDFGVIKEIEKEEINTSNNITQPCGTWLYIAPEQDRGNPNLSSDLYSLGLTAIEALTGLSINKVLENNWYSKDNWLHNILCKMTQKDCSKRYQNAKECFNDLTDNIKKYNPHYSDDFLYPFIEEQGNKWGYKNKYNKTIIQPQFQSAKDFSEELAAVQYDGSLWGYVNKDGIMKIHPKFNFAGYFSEGLARVRLYNQQRKDNFSYINKQGIVINKTPLNGALDFSEGLAPVLIGDKWGYMDEDGEISIKPQFYLAEKFLEGKAKVKIDDNNWKLIDKTGKPFII